MHNETVRRDFSGPRRREVQEWNKVPISSPRCYENYDQRRIDGYARHGRTTLLRFDLQDQAQAAITALASAPHILLRLALHRWRIRIFDPMRQPASAID
jgi:hypothetical protein